MTERSSTMTRLYRSRRDKVVTGLAGGLSETIGIDSTLFRILLLISIPFTGGTVIPVYIIAALIIPKEHYQSPFGPGGPFGGPYGGPHSGRPEHGPHGHGGYGGHGGQGGNGGNGGYGHYGSQSNYNPNFEKSQAYSAPDSGLDAMMKDIEKKALQKEVEELKQKLSKYEKGEV
ncbi:PspC domain-containing protein [Paenibacillus sp. NPDC057934]|uniref:PspC domain-containing protein n=1 Tax=Paenibacillus sp. NPDC057934 TaxID=3346282 RepID=UPI0036DC96A7